MSFYRVTLDVELAENITPADIQPAIDDVLGKQSAHFRSAKVRHVEGEFPTDRQDDFDEWRYCLGRYAWKREEMEMLWARWHAAAAAEDPS